MVQCRDYIDTGFLAAIAMTKGSPYLKHLAKVSVILECVLQELWGCTKIFFFLVLFLNCYTKFTNMDQLDL